ncbi:MAG: MATE family efflux transporter [Thermoguttaceae bacterium]
MMQRAATGELTGWWARPCGARDVLKISVPLITSMAALTVMTFIDRMFLLWYSEESMAAVLPSGMLHFSMICLPLGIASYVNTFVAQYHGAGQPQRIGPALSQGVRLGFYCIPLFLLLIPIAPWIFKMAGHEPALAAQETLFFQACSFGAGAEITAAALSALFTGLGETRVVMVVDSSAALLNGLLDYGWIFGHFGLPALGIEGAGWATVVALWFRVVAYLALTMLPRYRRPYRLWHDRSFDLPLFRRLLKFGVPNGLQLLVDVAGFTLFLLIIGRLGPKDTAATTLAFNVNALAFIPMLGLGVALSTLVGRQLGRNRPDMASRATWTALWLAGLYMGTMALVYVLLPDVLLMGHALRTPPAEFAQLRATTVVLLRFVAAYCLFDAMNVVFCGALKGAGDTRFVMIVSLSVTPLPLVAALVGMRYWNGGLLWCWMVITGWVLTTAFIYAARFLHGQWRHMRVIEPELLPDEALTLEP